VAQVPDNVMELASGTTNGSQGQCQKKGTC
jgi:hypothetical protein